MAKFIEYKYLLTVIDAMCDEAIKQEEKALHCEHAKEVELTIPSYTAGIIHACDIIKSLVSEEQEGK